MTTESPNSEPLRVDPRLIQELFDKDPLKLTNQDLDVIIGEFRAGRMAYLTPPADAPKAKSGSSRAKKASVDLESLGLQIDIEDLLPPPTPKA